MQYVFFTKPLREMDVPRLVDALRSMEMEGADLCVRDGYPVNPGNVRRELPAAAKRLREAGLTVPMISAPTGLYDPADPTAEALFAGCHDAGIALLKPGYWQFRPGPFQPQLDRARREIAGWQQLAERFGVRCCVHIHSGRYLTINTGSALLLVQDTDPQHIGLYLDPGHLALNGEPADMSVSMAGERLAIVAVKDLMWMRTQDARVRAWKCMPLGQGFVHWREWWRSLNDADFRGPVTIHSEYEGLDTDGVMAQARRDVQYLRELDRELQGRSPGFTG